jgi:hypothetical protein
LRPYLAFSATFCFPESCLIVNEDQGCGSLLLTTLPCFSCHILLCCIMFYCEWVSRLWLLAPENLTLLLQPQFAFQDQGCGSLSLTTLPCFFSHNLLLRIKVVAACPWQPYPASSATICFWGSRLWLLALDNLTLLLKPPFAFADQGCGTLPLTPNLAFPATFYFAVSCLTEK